MGGTVAGGSVCPFGWKLPLKGDPASNGNNKNGSFYNLLDKKALLVRVLGGDGRGVYSTVCYNVVIGVWRSGSAHVWGT